MDDKLNIVDALYGSIPSDITLEIDSMSEDLKEIYEAGLEAGRETAAKKALRDVALQMLADGFEPEVVSKYSKMDVEDVKALARQQMA